jgi:hypothetical protein
VIEYQERHSLDTITQCEGVPMFFFVRFTLPCGLVIVALILWILHLVFWPTIVADSMYGSEMAFSNAMKCGDWTSRNDQKVRKCTLATVTHEFEFVQRSVKNPDGSTLVVPQYVQARLKAWTAVLLTVSASVGVVLFWSIWYKAVSFFFGIAKNRGYVENKKRRRRKMVGGIPLFGEIPVNAHHQRDADLRLQRQPQRRQLQHAI